jgi:predicted RNA binding protein YcfA (HicA-like mRNA interferase family)
VAKFPADAPSDRVLRALAALGFAVVRAGNHVSLARAEPDGTITPMTLPGHRTIKGPTLRAALTQSGVPRDESLREYQKA